ncbi:MAG: type II toxin-antitoxin system VapC family toxin [Candidatus Gracilibacteria bacterium]|nr:type II toxin-antitoxin system VapC family toxin [Candidatus Gracilibacteria bacterium]
MEKSKKIYVLDSNVFIGAFYEDDSLHELSIQLLSEIKDSKIIVPYCVVQEVCSIFSYRFGKQKADDFLHFLLETDNIELINNDILDELNFYLSFQENLSFTDLSLILISQKYSAELLTFDKQLLKLYGGG